MTILVASAFGAGVMNSMAGGGTLLTFPALLLVGESAIRANATSTLALLPGSLASMAGYRREVETHKEWLRTLFVPSLVGGGLGSALLLRTPEATFASLAPFLVLFATLLFAVQALMAGPPAPTRPAAPSRWRWVEAWALQCGIAIYGGYFGAGMGILMLVVLGFLGLSDIHAMNGLKNFFGLCINATAALYFGLSGIVDWPLAALMMVGTAAGGYAGARFARRIGRDRARIAVIVIGIAATLLLFSHRA